MRGSAIVFIPFNLLVIGNLRCLSHDDSQAQSDALPSIEASTVGVYTLLHTCHSQWNSIWMAFRYYVHLGLLTETASLCRLGQAHFMM